MRLAPLLTALAVTLPPSASAAPSAACHCFTERTYQAERPAAADPYILATTRSSLLSAAFGPTKAALVRSAAPSLLESVRGGRATWGSTLDAAGIAPAALDGLVRAATR